MADRYWVGNDGSWNSTGNWATSSGGASGASVPTSSDNVYFDANSFDGASQSVDIDAGITATCADMNWTGATNTPTLNIVSTAYLQISGSLTFIASMALGPNTTGGNYRIVFVGTSGSHTITFAGVEPPANWPQFFTINGAGGTWTLQDEVSADDSTIQLLAGTLNTNGQTITCGRFTSSNTNTRVLTLGASVISCTQWDLNTTTGLTLNENTSAITVRDDSNDTSQFYGGGETYYDVIIEHSRTSIYGSNSFHDLTLDPAQVGGVSNTRYVYLRSETTQTMSNDFNADGASATDPVHIHTTHGLQAILSMAAGTASCSFLNLDSITGQGGATWDPGANSSGYDVVGWKHDFTNKTNVYASDNTYATIESTNSQIAVQVSKDGGSTWSVYKYLTFTGSDSEQTCGTGSSELWGDSWVGNDIYDANFVIRLKCGYGVSSSLSYEDYGTFGFDGDLAVDDVLSGIEVVVEAKTDGTTFSIDHLKVQIYYGDTPIGVREGAIAYDSTTQKIVVHDGATWANVADTYTAGEGIDVSVANVISGENASSSNKGIVELASNLETLYGTDTGRAVTPASLEYARPMSGWIQGEVGWAYASASSITMTGDYTGSLSVGMKIHMTQTTEKYFTITSVSYSAPSTTVNLDGHSTYTVANAGISFNWFSTGERPYGWPFSSAGVGDTLTSTAAIADNGTMFTLEDSGNEDLYTIVSEADWVKHNFYGDSARDAIVAAYSAGGDKKMEMYHNDTHGYIVSSSGDIILTPAGNEVGIVGGLYTSGAAGDIAINGGNRLYVRDSGGTKNIEMYHDGTNGNIDTTSGDIVLDAAGNDVLLSSTHLRIYDGYGSYWYSNGNDKYMRAWHNDTDAEIRSYHGDLRVTAADDIWFDALGNVVGVLDGSLFRTYSAGNDKYLSIYHDDSNAWINCSSGRIYLDSGNGIVWVDDILMYGDMDGTLTMNADGQTCMWTNGSLDRFYARLAGGNYIVAAD